ncbi:hypothetical protein V6Z12_D05G026800 [Gossypium hirsutum]
MEDLLRYFSPSHEKPKSFCFRFHGTLSTVG